MPFDTSTRLYSLLAERIKFPIRKEKRSDTICIKPIFTYGRGGGTRTLTVSLPMDFESIASTDSATPPCRGIIIPRHNLNFNYIFSTDSIPSKANPSLIIVLTAYASAKLVFLTFSSETFIFSKA